MRAIESSGQEVGVVGEASVGSRAWTGPEGWSFKK